MRFAFGDIPSVVVEPEYHTLQPLVRRQDQQAFGKYGRKPADLDGVPEVSDIMNTLDSAQVPLTCPHLPHHHERSSNRGRSSLSSIDSEKCLSATIDLLFMFRMIYAHGTVADFGPIPMDKTIRDAIRTCQFGETPAQMHGNVACKKSAAQQLPRCCMAEVSSRKPG